MVSEPTSTDAHSNLVAEQFQAHFGGNIAAWINCCERIERFATSANSRPTGVELYSQLWGACHVTGAVGELLELFGSADLELLLQRMRTLAILQHPLVPHFSAPQLARQLELFLDYQKGEVGKSLIATGMPNRVFAEGPWLDRLLRSLYPTRLCYEQWTPQYELEWRRYVAASDPTADGMEEVYGEHSVRLAPCQHQDAHLRSEFQPEGTEDELTGVTNPELAEAFGRNPLVDAIEAGRSRYYAVRINLLKVLLNGLKQGATAAEIRDQVAEVLGLAEYRRAAEHQLKSANDSDAAAPLINSVTDHIRPLNFQLAASTWQLVPYWLHWDGQYGRDDELELGDTTNRSAAPGGLVDLLTVVATVLAEYEEGAFAWAEANAPAALRHHLASKEVGFVYLRCGLANANFSEIDEYADELHERLEKQSATQRKQAKYLIDAIWASLVAGDDLRLRIKLFDQMTAKLRADVWAEVLQMDIARVQEMISHTPTNGPAEEQAGEPVEHAYAFQPSENFGMLFWHIRFNHKPGPTDDYIGYHRIRLLLQSSPQYVGITEFLGGRPALARTSSSELLQDSDEDESERDDDEPVAKTSGNKDGYAKSSKQSAVITQENERSLKQAKICRSAFNRLHKIQQSGGEADGKTQKLAEQWQKMIKRNPHLDQAIDDFEKARSKFRAISKSAREAIALRIRPPVPELAAHLTDALQWHCCGANYHPKAEIDWVL